MESRLFSQKKPRKSIPRISKKKLKALGGRVPFSTITSKPKAIARVSKRHLRRPDLIIKDDGREVCNPSTPGGKRLYAERLEQAFNRQYDPAVGYVRCCNCVKRLKREDATFEHERGRHPARIDERLELPDGTLLNGASHGWCNCLRGSKRTPIWHGPQERIG